MALQDVMASVPTYLLNFDQFVRVDDLLLAVRTNRRPRPIDIYPFIQRVASEHALIRVNVDGGSLRVAHLCHWHPLFVSVDAASQEFPFVSFDNGYRMLTELSAKLMLSRTRASRFRWVKIEDAKNRCPEMFPSGKESKFKSDCIVSATLGQSGAWTLSEGAPQKLVRLDAVKHREDVRSGMVTDEATMSWNKDEAAAVVFSDAERPDQAPAKEVLLRSMLHSGYLTKCEYSASMPQDMINRKMYLYTQVKSLDARDMLEGIVQVGSPMMNAASVAHNLLAMTTDMSFEELTDQTFVKYLVFPWKNVDNVVDHRIASLLEAFPSLTQLWPSPAEVDSLFDGENSALDNFVGLQGAKVTAACKGHVSRNLEDRVRVYVEGQLRLLPDFSCTGTFFTVEGVSFRRSEFWDWALGGEVCPEGVPASVRQCVVDLRLLAGRCTGKLSCDGLSYESAYALHKYITPFINSEVRYNSKGEVFKNKQRSLLPICSIGRVHVRLDQRVLSGLLTRKGLPDQTLDAFLGVHRMQQTRKNIRKKLRSSGQRGRRSKCGYKVDTLLGTLNRRVTSFETDGVALSVTFSFNGESDVRKRREVPTLARNDCEAAGYCDSNTHQVGIDPGRVAPLVAVSHDGTSYSSLRLTRKSLHRRCLFDRMAKQYEEYKSLRPDLRAAYSAMSNVAWKTVDVNVLLNMVDTCTVHADALRAERQSKRNALAAMVVWRRKNAVKDQVVSQFLRKWDVERKALGKKAVIVGYGNASFAPTGRREKAVPTKDLILRFTKAFRRLDISGGVVMTGEYLTTQMCHGCRCLTEEVKDADGHVDRNLRCCRGQCGQGHANNVMLRNRDRNAAINILIALVGWLSSDGRRPDYLTKAYKDKLLAGWRPHEQD